MRRPREIDAPPIPRRYFAFSAIAMMRDVSFSAAFAITSHFDAAAVRLRLLRPTS